jgi:hypothetical protein
MALSLKDVLKVSVTLPPRILFYGDPGIGKTTLASEFPEPIFLQIEDGTPGGVTLNSFGKLEKFPQVMEAIGALYTEEHDFQTLVIDSITELERLVFNETCSRGDDKGNKQTSIEGFGYGKGYVLAQRVWQELIDGINALRRDRGMAIILIAHSSIERFDDPESSSYHRYEIDLHSRSVGAIERDMDAIFLLKKSISTRKEDVGFNQSRAIAEGGSTTFIHTEGRPAFVAKNRYGLPAKIKYDRGKGFEALAPYFPTHANS